MEEKAAGPSEGAATKGARPPRGLVQDELTLKFVGTATLVVGLALLVASVIAIAALSILRFDVVPWLLIVPLALLVISVGGLVNGHYRRVIDLVLNPRKAEPALPPPPYPVAVPYGTVPPSPQVPAGYAPGYPAYPVPYPPAYPPGYAAPAPYPIPVPPGATPMRYCVTCGRRIPVASKFCPYCRHAYPA